MMGDLPHLDTLPPSPLPENLVGYFDQLPEHLDYETRTMVERLAEMMFAQGYIAGHRRGTLSASNQAIRERRLEIMPATRGAEVVRRPDDLPDAQR